MDATTHSALVASTTTAAGNSSAPLPQRDTFRRNSFASPAADEALEVSTKDDPEGPLTLDGQTAARPTLPAPRVRGCSAGPSPNSHAGDASKRATVGFSIPSPSDSSSRRRESSLVSSVAFPDASTPHGACSVLSTTGQLPQYSPTESDTADEGEGDDPPPVSTGTAPGAPDDSTNGVALDGTGDYDDDENAALAHVRFARRSSSVMWTALPKLNVRRRSSIGLALMLNTACDAADELLTTSGNPLQESGTIRTTATLGEQQQKGDAGAGGPVEDPNVVDLTGLHTAATSSQLPEGAVAAAKRRSNASDLDVEDREPISASASFVVVSRQRPSPAAPPVGRRVSATTTTPKVSNAFSFSHADFAPSESTDDAGGQQFVPPPRLPAETSPMFSPTQSFILGTGASGAVRSGFVTPGSPVFALGRGTTPTLHPADMAHVSTEPAEMAEAGDEATPAAVKIIRETSEDKAASAQCELAFAKRMAEFLIGDPAASDELDHIVRIYHVHRDRVARETAIAMELLPGTTVQDIPAFADLRGPAGGDADSCGTSACDDDDERRRDSNSSATVPFPAPAADIDACSSTASTTTSAKDSLGSPPAPCCEAGGTEWGSGTPPRHHHAAGSAMRAVQSTRTLASVVGTPDLRSTETPSPAARRLPRGSGRPSPASRTPSRVLSQSLTQAARTDTALRHVAFGALTGLRVLHEGLRVVHRDVKPANLLLDHRGAVKVADFGVACVIPEGADVRTGATGQAGSLSYMAPECIRGEPNGSPGDIWALGVTLLELAGGPHPYVTRGPGAGVGGSASRFWSVATALGALEGLAEREAKVDAIVSAHMDAHVRGLARRAGFEAFVRRCLAGDPKDRPSATELLRDPWLGTEA